MRASGEMLRDREYATLRDLPTAELGAFNSTRTAGRERCRNRGGKIDALDNNMETEICQNIVQGIC